MRRIFEKIALVCAFLLCLALILIGIMVWFSSCVWFMKFIVSFMLIITAIAFGAIGIDLWRDK